MITTHNTKLGSRIAAFNLPVLQTCPGASKACRTVCYADRGYFNMPNVQAAHAANLEAANSPEFVSRILSDIRQNLVDILRIHSAGDVYSAGYARKWLKIVQRCRRTVFYLYTRSWQDPEILAVLGELAKERNAFIWFSCDRTLPEPPTIPRIRRAWLATTDDDLPQFPVDLVFRARQTGTRKRIGGALVCPAEQNVERKMGKMTCSQCQLCFREPPGARLASASVVRAIASQ